MLDSVAGLREDQTILHDSVAKPWALAKPNPLMVKHLKCYENVTEHPLTELPAIINTIWSPY
jgi:hypothetical protein